MNFWKLLPASLAAAWALGGCDLGSPPQFTGGGTEVNGIAVDSRGEPLPYSWIRVFPDTGAGLAKPARLAAAVSDSALADKNGRYRFLRLPAGRYALLAKGERDDTVLAALVRGIEHDGSARDLGSLVLQVSGSIAIQVNALSTPLAGATCMIEALPGTFALSSAAGECLLAGLPPGNFRVILSYPGLPPMITDTVRVYSGQRSPGGNADLAATSGHLPAVPTLVSPAHGANVTASAVAFLWAHPDSAESMAYGVQIARDSLFTIRVLDTTLVFGSRVLIASLPEGNYYWRVNAANSRGTSAYSAPRSFGRGLLAQLPAPVPVHPAPGARIPDTATTLAWQPVPSATAYRIEITTDSAFIRNVQDTVVQGQLWNLRVNPATRYYWRVGALNETSLPSWSQVQWFEVDFVVAPLLLEPLPGEVTPAPVLSWKAIPGAVGYDLEIARDLGFANPIFTADHGHLVPGEDPVAYGVSWLPPDTYYWRIRARSTTATGPWSAARHFRVVDSAIAPTFFPITSATVALWSFDAYQESKIKDKSPNGLHLTVDGEVPLEPSPHGQAAVFNGDASKFVGPDDPRLALGATGRITVEARVFLAAYPGPQTQEQSSEVFGSYPGPRLLVTGDGRLTLGGLKASASGTRYWYQATSSPGVVPLNRWTTLAFSVDSAQGGRIYAFIDGVQIALQIEAFHDDGQTPRRPYEDATTDPFLPPIIGPGIGNDRIENFAFTGKIDEIRVSNALTLPVVLP